MTVASCWAAAGSSKSELKARKHWLQTRAEYLLALTVMGALRRLPLPLAAALSRTTTRTLDLALPKLRRVARINLAFAMPELAPVEREATISGVFESLARLLLAMARFPDLNAANVGHWISYEGLEHYLEAKRRGQGILVATAHLGNWELSAFTHALMTEPMNVMVRSLDNPLLDDLVESRRALSGNRLILKRDAARLVIRALKNNEAVGILVDQNTAASEGVFVNFFGKLACAGSAFVKLAQHSGAAVVPGFALWDKSRARYVLRFYPEIVLTGDVGRDTQRIHALIESVIREYPDQWMWIHRRWKTRPEGEPQLY
jgi:KDO2-lipid IV(A) lauroyltransferase